MALNDIDMYYVKCIGALHSTEHILKKEPSLLQLNLEDAIQVKTGVSKDFGPLIACLYSRPMDEIRTVVHGIEDIKTASSSDNELELDLFNEDLMCIICNGMDVAAGNQLIECSDCHSLYHQECHRPPVMTIDSEGTFTCQNCKDIAKSLKKSITTSSHIVSSPVANVKAIKSSPPQLKPPTSTNVPNYKSSSVSKSSSIPVSKSSKSSLKSTSSSSGGSKSVITPTINIISADKRLQIMKKKAAKLHEKKKHLTR